MCWGEKVRRKCRRLGSLVECGSVPGRIVVQEGRDWAGWWWKGAEENCAAGAGSRDKDCAVVMKAPGAVGAEPRRCQRADKAGEEGLSFWIA